MTALGYTLCQLEWQGTDTDGYEKFYCSNCDRNYRFSSRDLAAEIPCPAHVVRELVRLQFVIDGARHNIVRVWWHRRKAVQLWHKFRAARRRWKAAGKPSVPLPLLTERRAICQACPHRKKWWLFRICGKCFCLLRLKQKMGTEHCPIGNWPGDKEASPASTDATVPTAPRPGETPCEQRRREQAAAQAAARKAEGSPNVTLPVLPSAPVLTVPAAVVPAIADPPTKNAPAT